MPARPTPADAAGNCLQRALAHLAAARNHARAWQLDALNRAVADELTHPAMTGADPLTDSLLGQLDTCAAEGAQPALPYTHSQPHPQPEPAGWWLLAATLLAALAGLCFYPWGI